MIRHIKDFKNLPENVSKEWAINELKDFLEYINTIQVDTKRCYSKSFEKAYSDWNDYINEKLHEYNFINGKPEENTWEKLPKVAFWWCINCTSVNFYRPRYDNHCSSKELKEQMVNVINDSIQYIKGE